MTPKILVIRASGGLSNRLQAATAGVGYCLLTGRALCVDWRDGMYSDDFSNVFPLWFNVRGLAVATPNEAAALARSSGGVHPPFWEPRLDSPTTVEHLFNNDHMDPENVVRTSLDFRNLDYPHPVLTGWGWDLQPALSLAPLLRRRFKRFVGLSDWDVAARLLTEHIRPAPDLKAEADAFAEAHFTPGRTVGIHIRHTDLQSPLERMLQALHSTADPEDVIYLATDNRHVEKMVRKLFPRAVRRQKLFAPGDDPLHSHVPGLSNAQKGREAVIDMLLLARCDRIIHYRQSSFARVPTLLSGLAPSYIHQVE